jgi:hypothetical protein
VRWENVPLDDPEMAVVLRALERMPGLRLFHLQTTYAAQQTAAEELAFALPTLAVVGLGSHVWTVERGGPLLNMRQWSAKQVAMRTADTLGEAGEWLVRVLDVDEGVG